MEVDEYTWTEEAWPTASKVHHARSVAAPAHRVWHILATPHKDATIADRSS